MAEEPAQPTGDDELAPHERRWRRPWQPRFLESLALIPEVTTACRYAGINRRTAYHERDRDPGFHAAWQEALELAQDAVLRQAHRWIMDGLPVRKVNKRTRRKVVDGAVVEEIEETYETEAAERYGPLMIFWLKAYFPERFRFAEKLEHTGADGGPMRLESLSAIDKQIEQLSAELQSRARAAGNPAPPVE